jgi:hypothetical protein
VRSVGDLVGQMEGRQGVRRGEHVQCELTADDEIALGNANGVKGARRGKGGVRENCGRKGVDLCVVLGG